ncbi:MAG: hypothetical protein HOH14_03305 [Gammaproteobacteria bacterium]|mgnify:FL=1|jgi:hypothetical protein|nr:hypothetical protein [Gammaproteobacteria bacterium]MBT6042504.1 hypothetical protein [Gammaproteobacteria bacterium]
MKLKIFPNKLIWIFTALLALLAVPVIAHHSTAAFDSESVIKIEGEITQVRWINPHASFKLEGTVEGAPDGLWTIEMTAPNVLINQGWKRSSLRPGDKVTVFANPLRNAITLNDGSQGGLYIGVILKDGSTLGRTDGQGQGSDR